MGMGAQGVVAVRLKGWRDGESAVRHGQGVSVAFY